MPRFFVPTPLAASGDTIDLPDEVARHVQVLRLRAGDPLTLFDGSGGEHNAVLVAVEKRRVSVRLAAFMPVERETPYRVTLAQGLCSNEKMDWLVEKSVELGVTAMAPLIAARSVVRLDGERAARRRAHWAGLVAAACEQCGRNRLPAVAAPAGLADWLDAQRSTPGMKLMFSPRGSRPFDTLPALAPDEPVTLLVGPEGGLDEAEERLARQAGFEAISLGARILRAETAGIAVLAALAARWQGW
ncbi:16S rRNA (uracil(1498)-N(3))-methyltransferase [Chitinasiproducens palmae]|uniref:Ribosomal RNA small subunit methyltransferase E n=1 Tax=Chitinasiproducens palmae TaxID=1770053 RepID=A0A1H2PRH8_9BURK|nr:16S rRNA (uracil(1498)-N(3))-methyltransferase [Chitinasiproducens palmae]SDV49526.1 16S rRNA m(3)U-1498 methyltransferase [Chitinasiproducens palmae]